MTEKSKLLIITLGDPFSVNIEVISSMLLDMQDVSYPIVVIGSYWNFCNQVQTLELPKKDFALIRSFSEVTTNQLYFLDIDNGSLSKKRASYLSPKERGQYAVSSLYKLRDIDEDKYEVAVLTAPIDKKACAEAGFTYPGHTEYFCDLWEGQGIMILAGPKLRVGLATNHVSIKKIPELITQNLIEDKITLLGHSLKRLLKNPNPRIAVCGLNPHCGDNGLFGSEDNTIIDAAIRNVNESDESSIISGPYPADTIFFRAMQNQFDGVLAMYHDQGLGPLKTVHFYDAVNITGGLRHFRVSPDHGPAMDLFLKKSVNSESFKNAMSCCLDYLDGIKL